MKNQMVKDILVAIANVRGKVRRSMETGDTNGMYKYMGDLYALEVCLVIETEKLVREMDLVEAMNKKSAA